MEQETWLTQEEVAQLLDAKLRTIQWQCQNGKYLVRQVSAKGGKGGWKYEIALSCLPKPAQKAYLKRTSDAFEAGQREAAKLQLSETMTGLVEHQQREQALLASLSLTGKSKARDDHKSAIVAAYRRGAWTPEEYAAAYNRGEIEIDPTVREAIRSISGANFRRWLKAPAQGKHLGGQYGHRKGTGLIDSQPELREFILGLLAAKPHINYVQLHDALMARFRSRADLDLPKIKTVERWAGAWKEKEKQLHTLLTNPDQWNSSYRTAQGTINYAEYVNHIWRLDSSPNDVMLNDGKRHALIFTLDNYSRRLKIVVAPTSKATAVAACMRRALLDWGKPARIKTDNGAEYVGLHIGRVCSFLGIEHELCNAFSGWEKGDVERVVKTLAHGIVSLLPGFVGHNVAERKAIESRKSFAERLMNKDAEPPELRMSPADMQKFCDDWCDHVYQHADHEGLGGKTPFQRAAECREPVQWIGNERVLDLLLAEAASGDGWRTVTKQGITIDKEPYVAPELGLYVKKKVLCLDHSPGRIVVYGQDRPDDPLNPNAIQPGLHFVCIAECASGMSREERMNKAKAATTTQSQAVRGDRRKVKAVAKKVGADNIAHEILADKMAQTATIHAFPKPKIEHTTAGIAAAHEALEALDGQEVRPFSFEEVQALREKNAAAKRVERPLFENAVERALWLAGVRMGDIEAELSGEDDEFLRELRRANPLACRLVEGVLNHRYEGRWDEYGAFRRAVGWPEARRPRR
jgi:putative transposase